MAEHKPNQFTPLPRPFFRPSAEIVAPKLLGHWLIRNTPSGLCGGLMVETEAYIAGDEACHAFRGETKRNKSMWGPPGHGYIYFIYGNYWCFNVVCLPPGKAEAVLIRAVEPTIGLDLMRQKRVVSNERDLTNGPGKLCMAMDIDRTLEGVDLCDAKSPLFIAENTDLKATLKKLGPIVTTTRIGITRSASLPLRFYLDGSHFVSQRAKA